jgi:two-component system nitrogen regulation response regulator GlnG
VPDWSGNELTLPEVVASLRGEPDSKLALTVLYHPEPGRIGAMAPLQPSGGHGIEAVSRLEPLFSSANRKDPPMPLADPYLSRTPLEVDAGDAGVTFRAPAGRGSFKIDGRLLVGEALLGWDEIQSGVVISLSHRVVLLLHPHTEEPDSELGGELVGESSALRRLRSLITRVANTDTPVLLLGETGTGKELVAASIHAGSPRAASPMVSVNMAALPAELAAAELFGVRRGAFTGAEQDRKGYFQQADGGTLFLDEIGACSEAVQPQLLRALQQGEIQLPGGGTRRVDVRVVAATDENLDAPESRFSTALRHRLAGFEIRLPPLRARREDLGRLLRHFLPSAVLEAATAEPREVSRWADLMEKFAAYQWPGNVREFSNVCRQLTIAGAGESRLVIPDSLASLLAAKSGETGADRGPSAPPSDTRIREAMTAARWEIAEAARELRISRQALYRRIEAIPELRVAADIGGAEIESVYRECKGDIDEAALRLQVSRAALRRRWRAMDLIPGGY